MQAASRTRRTVRLLRRWTESSLGLHVVLGAMQGRDEGWGGVPVIGHVAHDSELLDELRREHLLHVALAKETVGVGWPCHAEPIDVVADEKESSSGRDEAPGRLP
jgi:hypothetical protein